jgi:hypothetical protein
MSVVRGKAEDIQSERVFPTLTQLRHCTVVHASVLQASFSPIKEFVLAIKMLFFGVGGGHAPRRFVTLFGGTAMWSRAPQPRTLPTIGVLGREFCGVQSTGAFVQRLCGAPL